MLNVVALMGRLTAEPELKHTPNGVAVTSFTIAVDRSYVKSGQDRQTDFINCVAWRNNAEFISKYFRKGQLMAVQGEIQTRTYTDKDGNKRKVTEVIVNTAHFAEPKRENNSSNSPSAAKANAPAPAPSEPAYSGGDTGDFEDIPSDDDLPF